MTKRKHPGGRPTVMTPDVLQKLEDAFMNAFTDAMACLYAGISERALYDYCAENEKFAQRKEILKRTPDLAAQKKLVEDAGGSVGGARWWAEHRMPEFMPKSKVEHAGRIETSDTTTTDAARVLSKEYDEKLRQLIIEDIKKPKQTP